MTFTTAAPPDTAVAQWVRAELFLLAEKGALASEVSGGLSVSHRAVQRALGLLEREGLAVRRGRRWFHS